MIRVTHDWDDEIHFAIQSDDKTRDAIKAEVRRASFRLKRGVQLRMPVDTGAARASWGATTAPPPANPTDGIWEVKRGGFEIVQGSRRSYIQDLNDGSSVQAPAGFIDAEVLKATSSLDDALVRILDRVYGSRI